MGGRGAYSFTYQVFGAGGKDIPLKLYATSAVNAGGVRDKGHEAAVERFRSLMLTQKVEYSAYVDNQGFMHALGSTQEVGRTRVASLTQLAKQKGVSAVIHNHPSSKGRWYGGSFSANDILFLGGAFYLTNGKINTIYATANEGTYKAVFTKQGVREKDIKRAMRKAESTMHGSIFRTKKKMWDTYHNAVKNELAPLGIEVSFTKNKKKFRKKGRKASTFIPVQIGQEL